MFANCLFLLSPLSRWIPAAFSVLSAAVLLQGCVQSIEPRSTAHTPTQQERALRDIPTNLSARQAKLDARKAQMNRDYMQAQQACYTRFFVNSCLAKVQKRYRQEKASLYADQLVLEEAKRAKRVRQRDKKAVLQPSRASQHHAEWEAEQHIEGQSSRAKTASHANKKHPISRRQAEKRHSLSEQRARADNMQRFYAKQRAAEQHRLMMERRRAARKRTHTAPTEPSVSNTVPAAADLSP